MATAKLKNCSGGDDLFHRLLAERHTYGLAFGYVLGSVVASITALSLGLALFRGVGQ